MRHIFTQQNIKYILFIFLASVWGSVCFVLPDFIDNPHEGLRGVLALVVYVGALGVVQFLFLYAISTYRLLAAVLYPIYAIIGAGLAFYRVVYHVSLTPLIIDVTLHTNAEEALGVMSWQLWAWIMFNVLIAVLLIIYRWKKIMISHPWIHLLASILLLGIYSQCNGRLRQSIRQRYPANIVYVGKEYILSKQDQTERRVPSFQSSHSDEIQLIFILGEAVRADHLGLNGYPQNTTPRLEKEDNLISFPNVYSPYTHTTASIPYIITRADSAHEDRTIKETSFIPILKQCGYRTYWISNQDLGGSFAYFPSECDSSIFVNKGKTDYVFHPWVDEDLLPIIQEIIQIKEVRQAYMIHLIGSHWYYNNHVPQKQQVYQPTTTNRLITANTREQIINSYDNTILYMDSVVEEIISYFRKENAILIFLSDHSESLGEEGRWLHASDAEEQKHPACFIWYSDRYQQCYPHKIAAAQKNRTTVYNTDFLFYSILSAVGIEGQDYDVCRDVFANPLTN